MTCSLTPLPARTPCWSGRAWSWERIPGRPWPTWSRPVRIRRCVGPALGATPGTRAVTKAEPGDRDRLVARPDRAFRYLRRAARTRGADVSARGTHGGLRVGARGRGISGRACGAAARLRRQADRADRGAEVRGARGGRTG